MFTQFPDIIKVIIFSLLSVIYLFIVSKILGKKQIAQLQFIDYVIGISIGSISAEMATDLNDTPFYLYLVSVTVFFLFSLLISFLGRKGAKMKHFFKGRPEVIIYKGKIVYKNLKRSKLDVNDILCLSREQGYFDVSDIDFAIFETSGNLSIIPKSEYAVATRQDLKDLNNSIQDKKTEFKIVPAKLPFYLIIDGAVSFSSLRELNMDFETMLKKANIQKSDIKKIILAEYDKESDVINLQYKD